MNIIQATQPNWFGNHAWILPVSFVLLFVGLLVWLCQYRWAQRVLGILPDLPQEKFEHKDQKPLVLQGDSYSRLKIMWAHYGAEGGPVKEVAEEYLRPRIRGDSLIGWVGSDLFGPLDPANGLQKQLRVRYSFDDNEATITRPEHALLVLPEDPFLKEALSQERELAQRYKVDLQESANRNLEYRAKLNIFSALQWEALQLSNELTDFLKELGPPPAPRYTYDQIQKMSSAETRRLIEANDGDFAEACEYYNGKGSMRLTQEGLYQQLVSHHLRMWPWYDKVTDAYDERFKSKIESIKRRITAEGLQANGLLLPVGGPQGAPNIRAIAAKLWELAYQLKEKDLPNDKDPRLP